MEKMENDVLDSLEDLGYTGPVSSSEVLSKAVQEGSKSVPYTQVVEWLVQQISDFTGTEERVHAIANEDDASNFLLELSGFLREYGCPYKDLIEGPVNDRLKTTTHCLQLLDYLTCELQAVRMIAKKRPGMLLGVKDTSGVQTESEVAGYMKKMLIALGFPKPPPNITAFQLFSKLEAKIKELMATYSDQIGKPLLKARLSDKQWQFVMEANATLAEEYRIRREMLLKRLDVTIQSFMWSDKAKSSADKIAQVYQPIRAQLQVKTTVGIPEILAARDNLTQIQKTSSGDARKECAINKVLIGRVPDRGGRAWELEPPPPEMPAFIKRDSAPQGQRPHSGRGGGGDGGRGGRVQGGWGGANTQSYGGQWDQGGGGYQGGGKGGGGGYHGGGGYQGGGGGYQGGGGGYQGGGGGYQGGGGGYQGGGGGGGGYHQGGGGYHGGGGYQGGGGGYQGGGYQEGGGGYQGGGGGYQGKGGGGYHGGGGRGGRGRDDRGRGGRRGRH